jgi:glucose/arabinose dehydrogenase
MPAYAARMTLHRRHLLALGLAAPAIARAEPPIIAAVPATPGARVTPVLEGLENPWAIAWLPDGSALVTERPGRLRRVVEGVLAPRPVEGVPEVLALGQGGFEGAQVDRDQVGAAAQGLFEQVGEQAGGLGGGGTGQGAGQNDMMLLTVALMASRK